MSSITPAISPSLVPVTVIGGFLGTGKTTLLNEVLSSQTGIRYAVMVNDFGSLAVDDALVKAHDGDTISFANGCVCCSLGDNLIKSIDALLERDPKPEQFLIEVSGVANPKAIADVATLHPGLRRDLIITLVDAETVMERAGDPRLADTLSMQLVPADLIVLNKCDLVGDTKLARVCSYLSDLYPSQMVRTVHSRLPVEYLSAKVLTDPLEPKLDLGKSEPATQSSHDPESQFYRCTVNLPDNMMCDQLRALLREHQSSLLRAKGFVYDEQGTLVSIQLSGNQIEVQSHFDGAGEFSGGSSKPYLVAIGLVPLDAFKQAVLANLCQ